MWSELTEEQINDLINKLLSDYQNSSTTQEVRIIMPYKSEKIKIEHTKHDRRCKLTDVQKDQIIALRGKISQRKCAEMFKVSRRTIVFLWFPERLEANKQVRQARGGWRQYYKKENNTEYMSNHRHYKQELYINNEIK